MTVSMRSTGVSKWIYAGAISPCPFATSAYWRTSHILETLCTTVVLMTKGDSKYEPYLK